MRILLLAPHPFYQERGTPIAVDLLLKVLSEAGHEIDVVTFPEGADRVYPRVRIYRTRPWGGVAGVRPGFSAKKLYCDVFLFWLALRMLRRGGYDVVHAVEESAFFALVYRLLFRVPFIYDMDSLLSTQIIDKFPKLSALEGLFKRLESLPIRRAVAVAPMCQDLADRALEQRADGVVVIKDVSLIDDSRAPAVTDLTEEFGVNGPVVMYIGNLEAYQGIDLLLESFARVDAGLQAKLIVIGGIGEHIDHYRQRSQALGVGERVHFTGPRPVETIGAYMRQADVLVSPRVHGTNTPMKIYSYLHSGVAVLATALPTHTQVLNSTIAMLAPAGAGEFGAALETLLSDSALRGRLGSAGAEYAEREHGFERFVESTTQLYDVVAGQCASA